MTALTKWNPFREMEELQNRLSSVLNWSWSPVRSGRDFDRQERMTVAEWAPVVDITETRDEYLIKAELPGVNKDDLRVTVEEGVLTISGERRAESEEKGARHHRIERFYGSFARSFTIPSDADESRVTADFKNGLLIVHVAKDEKAKPKAIDVKIA